MHGALLVSTYLALSSICTKSCLDLLVAALPFGVASTYYIACSESSELAGTILIRLLLVCTFRIQKTQLFLTCKFILEILF
jgi:hypothetical protein